MKFCWSAGGKRSTTSDTHWGLGYAVCSITMSSATHCYNPFTIFLSFEANKLGSTLVANMYLDDLLLELKQQTMIIDNVYTDSKTLYIYLLSRKGRFSCQPMQNNIIQLFDGVLQVSWNNRTGYLPGEIGILHYIGRRIHPIRQSIMQGGMCAD